MSLFYALVTYIFYILAGPMYGYTVLSTSSLF